MEEHREPELRDEPCDVMDAVGEIWHIGLI